jgi:1,4-dihydroxy-2-naphthoyl-CoA hydrolase
MPVPKDQPDMTTADHRASRLPPFPELLGCSIVETSPERVIFRAKVTEALLNRNGVLHGGAILGMADSAGGQLASANLQPGKATTTIESKTNFLRPIRLGDEVTITSVPLHLGRATMLIETTITRPDGTVAAIVTQTQMTLDWVAG